MFRKRERTLKLKLNTETLPEHNSVVKICRTYKTHTYCTYKDSVMDPAKLGHDKMKS